MALNLLITDGAARDKSGFLRDRQNRDKRPIAVTQTDSQISRLLDSMCTETSQSRLFSKSWNGFLSPPVRHCMLLPSAVEAPQSARGDKCSTERRRI